MNWFLLTRNADVPRRAMKTQNSKIIDQTKQPAQKLMKTVNPMEIMKATATTPPISGHPSLRSAKYSCRMEIFINSSNLNSLTI